MRKLRHELSKVRVSYGTTLLLHTVKKKEVLNFTCLSQWHNCAGDISKQKQSLDSTRSVNLQNS